MTNVPPVPSHALRQAIAAIDATHPLRMPWYYDESVTGPRLDRLDAKAVYHTDYIEYLERRIAALEERLEGSPS